MITVGWSRPNTWQPLVTLECRMILLIILVLPSSKYTSSRCLLIYYHVQKLIHAPLIVFPIWSHMLISLVWRDTFSFVAMSFQWKMPIRVAKKEMLVGMRYNTLIRTVKSSTQKNLTSWLSVRAYTIRHMSPIYFSLLLLLIQRVYFTNSKVKLFTHQNTKIPRCSLANEC